MTFTELEAAQRQTRAISLEPVRADYAALVQRIRQAGITVSDRRAVKLQRIVAASALLCGRLEARTSDLWILRNIWHTEDQREILRALVQEAVARDEQQAQRHPGADGASRPDPEALARELAWIESQMSDVSVRAIVRDRLALVESQLPWVPSPAQRDELAARAKQLWTAAGSPNA